MCLQLAWQEYRLNNYTNRHIKSYWQYIFSIYNTNQNMKSLFVFSLPNKWNNNANNIKFFFFLQKIWTS